MNSRIRAFAISMTVLFLLPALAHADVTVPKGTVISVVTDQGVSSKDAKAGQPVSATGGKVL